MDHILAHCLPRRRVTIVLFGNENDRERAQLKLKESKVVRWQDTDGLQHIRIVVVTDDY